MYYYNLIEDEQMNFTINRALTYGNEAVNPEEVKEAAPRIHDFDDWYREMYTLAVKAEKEERRMHAAFYYRMAEFFLPNKVAEKEICYEGFIKNFYQAVDSDLERFQIPYEGSFLPALRMKAENERGIVLMHGGYDSFMEEFYLGVKDVLAHGYTLIMFEGPGQGTTLRHGFKFTHKWEEPTSAVLDYFELEKAALVGISWGGFLAPRAAAFDKRITQVVSYDVMYDGLDMITNQMPNHIKGLFRWLVRNNWRKVATFLTNYARKKSLTLDWALRHGMYITGTADAFSFFEVMSQHRLKDVGHLITQDVLLLAGEEDHLIPLDHLKKSEDVLTNAKSVHSRLFTKEEGGEQHCQTGAVHLATDEIISWLDQYWEE